MLGTACFRLCYRGSSHCSTTVALSQLHYSSPHPYSTQVIYRPHVGSPSLSRSLSWPRQQAFVNAEGCDLPVLSTIKRSCCHTSLCVEGGHEVSCATIWHGLLPSHHPSILDQNGFSPFKSCFDPHYLTSLPSSPLSLLCKEQGFSDPKVSAVGLLRASSGRATHGSVVGLSTPHGTVTGLGRLAMAASLLDGSWNVAWDVRPARWLHGRHSAWLLFGVCTCFSAGMGVSVPSMLPSPLPHVEGITDQLIPAQSGSSYEAAAASNALQGKQVYTDYTVTGIPGDGRCLFRAIAYGACLRSGKPAPRESLQQELADDLRNKVVDELVGRRSESEWFIEEDFDTYVKRMREPYVWGGEPELLMASHVLKMPITVHWFDKSSEGLISIAEYGSEYGSENPIRVLFHGFGHYDAVQVPGSGTNSKL